MKYIKIKSKDTESADSVIARKSLQQDRYDKEKLAQAESVYYSFNSIRERRARVIRFVYEDQWGDTIVVNGKTMTQREYLAKQGNIALQANLMASKANSIVGSHIKEGTIPSLIARAKKNQRLGEVLSETFRANWENNDMNELEASCEFELLFGGLCAIKESYERINGSEDTWSRMVNPNMFAFSSSMQDPRLNDLSMIVELHEYTFNELCAAYVESPEDYSKLRELFYNSSHPHNVDDWMDADTKLDEAKTFFYNPNNTKNCRVIEVWTRERRPRYHCLDQQTAEFYDINADDVEMVKYIKAVNKERTDACLKAGFTKDEVPVIEMHYFIDTYWFVTHLSPGGYILYEGESTLPNKEHPYTICATPFINGKICGFISDAVDLQMAINRELVIYDWMKRLGTKGVTFVPQSIIPDGMDYSTFAEQWTSMDGIVYYKPTNNGDRPFVEHSSLGNLNTAEMIKMLSDTMAESVSVSGAIQGKTPYAGTSAQLYAQQKENSTTPIAVVAGKLETFIKHVAVKKASFIQKFYPVSRYQDIVDGMEGFDYSALNLGDIADIQYKYKVVQLADRISLRHDTNELLMSMVQMGAMNIADVLDLGGFENADAIIQRLNQREQEARQQQEQMQAMQAAQMQTQQQTPEQTEQQPNMAQ